MKKTFWKKLYYHYIRNIPWYVLNESNQNVAKQIKLEERILNLLTAKNFKVTNPELIKPDEKAVNDLPSFLEIEWPKGTDGSYFESYQVLQYFETIGMISFRLTLKNNVSKVFKIKGFDTWQDVLKQTEEFIKTTFNKPENLKLLSDASFVVHLDETYNNTLSNIYQQLSVNKFVKPLSLHFKITAIDEDTDSYDYELTWDLDPKFVYQQTINSVYVKNAHDEKDTLAQFIHQVDVYAYLSQLDPLKIEQLRTINEVFHLQFRTVLEEKNLLDLEINHIYFDENNKTLIFYFQTLKYQNKQELIVVAEQALAYEKQILALQRFLNDLKTQNTLMQIIGENSTTLNWQNFWNSSKFSSSDYALQMLKQDAQFNFVFELQNKNNSYLKSQLDLTNTELLLKTNDLNLTKTEWLSLILHDVNFWNAFQQYINEPDFVEFDQQVFANYLTKHYALNTKLAAFDFPIQYLMTLGKEKDEINFTLKLETCSLTKTCTVSNSWQQLSKSQLLQQLQNNQPLNDFLKNLPFETITNQTEQPKISNQIVALLKNQKITILDDFLDSSYFRVQLAPDYDHLTLIMKNANTQTTIQTINYHLNNHLYKLLLYTLNSLEFQNNYLKQDPDFFSETSLNQTLINDLLSEQINGWNHDFAQIQKQFDVAKPEEAVWWIHFKALYAPLQILWKKPADSLNLSEMVNKFCAKFQQIYTTSTAFVWNEQQTTYSLQEIIQALNLASEFIPLSNQDFVFNISNYPNLEDPRLMYEIVSIQNEIQVYDYVLIFNLVQTWFGEFWKKQEDAHSELKQTILTSLNKQDENWKTTLFTTTTLPKWFKEKMLRVKQENSTLIFVYLNQEIFRC